MEDISHEQLTTNEDTYTAPKNTEIAKKAKSLTKIGNILKKTTLVSGVALILFSACTGYSTDVYPNPTKDLNQTAIAFSDTQILMDIASQKAEEEELLFLITEETREEEILEAEVKQAETWSYEELKNTIQEIDVIIENKEVIEVLNLLSDININEKGELTNQGISLKKDGLVLDTTDKLLKSIDFFVVHYDTSSGKRAPGNPSVADQMINFFINRSGAGTQFAIDSYPVNGSTTKGEGHGVLQIADIISSLDHASYTASNAHKTAGLIPNNRRTGEVSDYTKQVQTRGINFNLNEYALGAEMTGNNFSKDFPNNMPPPQLTANLLSLLQAVSKEYNLKVWDILGHHEVGDGKSDPGDEYMLTVRYMLGIIYAKNPNSFGDDFLSGATLEEYFEDLKEYAIARMGKERFEKWNEIYEMDKIFLLEQEENGVNIK